MSYKPPAGPKKRWNLGSSSSNQTTAKKELLKYIDDIYNLILEGERLGSPVSMSDALAGLSKLAIPKQPSWSKEIASATRALSKIPKSWLAPQDYASISRFITRASAERQLTLSQTEAGNMYSLFADFLRNGGQAGSREGRLGHMGSVVIHEQLSSSCALLLLLVSQIMRAYAQLLADCGSHLYIYKEATFETLLAHCQVGGIDMDTRHAAIDGLGNLFKACTVTAVEGAVGGGREQQPDRDGNEIPAAVQTERILLATQLRSVLDVIVVNLQDCMGASPGGESVDKDMPLQGGVYSSLVISVVRAVVCIYSSPFAKFVPVNAKYASSTVLGDAAWRKDLLSEFVHRLVPLLSTVLRQSYGHLQQGSGGRSEGAPNTDGWSSPRGGRGSRSPSPSQLSPGRSKLQTQRKDCKEVAQRFVQHACYALAALASFDSVEFMEYWPQFLSTFSTSDVENTGCCIFSYVSSFENGEPPRYGIAAAGALRAIFEHAPPLFSLLNGGVTGSVALSETAARRFAVQPTDIAATTSHLNLVMVAVHSLRDAVVAENSPIRMKDILKTCEAILVNQIAPIATAGESGLGASSSFCSLSPTCEAIRLASVNLARTVLHKGFLSKLISLDSGNNVRTYDSCPTDCAAASLSWISDMITAGDSSGNGVGVKSILSDACSAPLLPCKTWSIGSYLQRTDPAASVSSEVGAKAWGQRVGATSLLGKGAESGSTGEGQSGGRWRGDREGHSLPFPSPPVTGGMSTVVSSVPAAELSFPIEVLVKKCLYLLGYRETVDGDGSFVECMSRYEKGPAGRSGLRFLRSGVWDGDGESCAVCFAALQALNTLVESFPSLLMSFLASRFCLVELVVGSAFASPVMKMRMTGMAVAGSLLRNECRTDGSGNDLRLVRWIVPASADGGCREGVLEVSTPLAWVLECVKSLLRAANDVEYEVRLEAARRMKNILCFVAAFTFRDSIAYQVAVVQALVELCGDCVSPVVRTGACKHLGEVVAMHDMRPQLSDEKWWQASVMFEDCRAALLHMSSVSTGGDTECDGVGVVARGLEALSVSIQIARVTRSALDMLLENLIPSAKIPNKLQAIWSLGNVLKALLSRRMLAVCEEYSDRVALREHSHTAGGVFRCCCVSCMDVWACCCGSAQWMDCVQALFDIIEREGDKMMPATARALGIAVCGMPLTRSAQAGLMRALWTLIGGNAGSEYRMDTSFFIDHSTVEPAWPVLWTDDRLYQMLTAQYRNAVPKLAFSLCQVAGGILWNIYFQQHCSLFRVISAESLFSSNIDVENSSEYSAATASTYEVSSNILLFLLRLDQVSKTRRQATRCLVSLMSTFSGIIYRWNSLPLLSPLDSVFVPSLFLLHDRAMRRGHISLCTKCIESAMQQLLFTESSEKDKAYGVLEAEGNQCEFTSRLLALQSTLLCVRESLLALARMTKSPSVLARGTFGSSSDEGVEELEGELRCHYDSILAIISHNLSSLITMLKQYLKQGADDSVINWDYYDGGAVLETDVKVDELSRMAGLYNEGTDTGYYSANDLNPCHVVTDGEHLAKATCLLVATLFFDAGQLDLLKFTMYEDVCNSECVAVGGVLRDPARTGGTGGGGGRVPLFYSLMDVLASSDRHTSADNDSLRSDCMTIIRAEQDSVIRGWIMDDVLPAIRSCRLGRWCVVSTTDAYTSAVSREEEDDDEI